MLERCWGSGASRRTARWGGGGLRREWSGGGGRICAGNSSGWKEVGVWAGRSFARSCWSRWTRGRGRAISGRRCKRRRPRKPSGWGGEGGGCGGGEECRRERGERGAAGGGRSFWGEAVKGGGAAKAERLVVEG